MKLSVFLCFLSVNLTAATVLEWEANPPVEYLTNVVRVHLAAIDPNWSEDGTLTTNVTTSVLAGYFVYSGPAPRSYSARIDVGNVTSNAIAASTGRVYYAVTAYNTEGMESVFSDEVVYGRPIIRGLKLTGSPHVTP